MIDINAYQKRDDQSKKLFAGVCSLTGAMVSDSSYQTMRRGRGENTKKLATLLLAVTMLQYVYAFVNSSCLMRRKNNQLFGI
jgi:hypothetical protein